jgi:hypothetical protein
MLMSWVIPVVSGLSAIVTLFVSKPEKKWALWASVVLILITMGVATYDQLSSQRTSEAIQSVAYENLSLSTSQFRTMISRMITEASDGWLPANEDEYFSRASVDLVCRRLNALGRPDVAKRQIPWYELFAQSVQEYKNTLNDVLGKYSLQLPHDLILAIREVETSTLLWLPLQMAWACRCWPEMGLHHPPLLCYGSEDDFEKSFNALKVLSSKISKGEKEFGLTNRMTTEQLFSGLKAATPGANRYSDPRIP